MNYLVSVIIPSYKRWADMVGRAIDSVLCQTYKNLEIILIDDNARHEHIDYRASLECLVKEKNSDKIKYIQNAENLGGAGARNIGIENAAGEFITFLDDDDIYLPEKIETQLSYMLKNDLDMSFTDTAIHNENDELIDYRSHKDIISFDKEYLIRYHLTKQISATNSFMVKKDILDQIGGFDIVPMGQEFYLMYKIINKGCNIGYLNRSDFILYRTQAEAISTGPGKLLGERKLYAFKKAHFKALSFSERRYVRCRHYAVMAVSYKRNKKYLRAMLNLFLSVLSAPLLAIREAFSLKRRISALRSKKTGECK